MANEYSDVGGSVPDFYDRGLGPVFFEDFAADLAARVAASRPARILEIAAGTGILTRRLRNLLPQSAELTATDLTLPMLDVARRKFAADDRVTFQRADATALPFPDRSFDAVVCQFGVMFFPDKERSYREAFRMLSPGGRYFVSVWDSFRRNRVGELIHSTIGSFFPADPPPFFQGPYAYHRIDPIKEALTDAGFADIRVAVLRHVREIADPPLFAQALIHGSPVLDQIRQRGDIDPARIVEAVTAALRREFGADPCRIDLQVIVFEATRP